MIRDLVVCSLEPWDEVWRRNQFLIAGLIETEPELRVLFVEPPTDPAHELLQRRRPLPARGLRRRAEFGEERLWTYQQTKLAPRRFAGPAVDKWLAAGVQRVARQVGMADPLLWVNDPAGATLAGRSGWTALYDITDDWLVADRTPQDRARIQANEAELMRRSSVVVVCSPHLAEVKGRLRDVELITNAVDVDRYRRPTSRPTDLPDGDYIVYVGTLHEDRLDVELCVATARAVAGTASVVFVGPNSLALSNVEKLSRESNIVLLGARPSSAVPAYLQHASVLIVPHVVTEFTESLNPIKLYEYLAVSRPIVSTPVAGFREAAGPVALVSADLFAGEVRRSLNEPEQATACAQVELPTWAMRVDQMREVLNRIATR